MKKCAFCNEQIKMSLDHCSFCGSGKEVSSHDDSNAYKLDQYIKAFKNDDLRVESLDEYGLNIKNWQIPAWVDFGFKTDLKATLKSLMKQSYLLLLGIVMLLVGSTIADRWQLFITGVIALIAILIKHNNFLLEAMKFENPYTENGHTIYYNFDNFRGGRGREAFILNNGDFELIKMYYHSGLLSFIEFGEDKNQIAYVGKYADLDVFERFMILYAHKYDVDVEIITDPHALKDASSLVKKLYSKKTK